VRLAGAIRCGIALTLATSACASHRKDGPFPYAWEWNVDNGGAPSACGGLDLRSARTGSASGYLSMTHGVASSQVYLSQTMDARLVRGKKVTVTAHLKTSDVQNDAFLFVLLAEGIPPTMCRTTSREGSLDWHRVDLRIDVPTGTRVMQVGFALSGPGRMWADDVSVGPAPRSSVATLCRALSRDEFSAYYIDWQPVREHLANANFETLPPSPLNANDIRTCF
jgi:hypothetical protein